MKNEQFILVIADGSKEMDVALKYACARSKKTSRKIMIASFIQPLDVLTTQGVTEIMQNEAREEAEKNIKFASDVVKKSTGELPVINIREGEIIQELKNLINEEKNISVLVLGANVDEKEKNPGPIINSLVSKELSNFRIPIMIVPGNFSNEHISLIS
jgi:Universal stress protein UspA and related nucleotide-binding proteins